MCLSTAAACPADRSCLGGMRSDVSALNSKKVASHHRHSHLPRLLPQNSSYKNLLKPESQIPQSQQPLTTLRISNMPSPAFGQAVKASRQLKAKPGNDELLEVCFILLLTCPGLTVMADVCSLQSRQRRGHLEGHCSRHVRPKGTDPTETLACKT